MSDVDLTKFPDGPVEIIKYLDFLPDDPDVRMEYLMGFVTLSIIELA